MYIYKFLVDHVRGVHVMISSLPNLYLICVYILSSPHFSLFFLFFFLFQGYIYIFVPLIDASSNLVSS